MNIIAHRSPHIKKALKIHELTICDLAIYDLTVVI